MRLHSRFSALAVPALLVLVGCSSMIPSLAPRLHDNAVAYDAAISDINDRVLLANIVRARDYVPLSMTELSTITGTLSEQASLGLSVPLGEIMARLPAAPPPRRCKSARPRLSAWQP